MSEGVLYIPQVGRQACDSEFLNNQRKEKAPPAGGSVAGIKIKQRNGDTFPAGAQRKH